MEKADFITRENITNLLVHSVILLKTKAVVKGNIPVITVITADALSKPPFSETDSIHLIPFELEILN